MCLKDLRIPPGALLIQGEQGIVSFGFVSPCSAIQELRDHYNHGLHDGDVQTTKCMQSWRLTSRFQRKSWETRENVAKVIVITSNL